MTTRTLVRLGMLALVVGALPAAPLTAQRLPIQRLPVRFGLQLGANSANVGGDDADFNSARMGLSGGVFIRIPLGGMLSIQPEAMFSMQGTKIDLSDLLAGSGLDVSRATFKISYVQIPVLARVTVPTRGSVAPFFYGGPSVGIKVGCSAGYSGPDASTLIQDASSAGVDIEDCDTALSGLVTDFGSFTGVKVKGTDVSAVLGGGIDLAMGRRRISVGVRYLFGLSSAVDVTGGTVDLKNRVLSLLVGMSL